MLRKFIVLTVILLFPLAAGATPLIIDFETDASGVAIQAGQILDDEYLAWGILISVVNDAGGPNLGLAFDTNNFTGEDDDLAHPFTVGNATGKNYGKVLIIAEDDVDEDGDGLVDDPDDEGGRPAGQITFDLDFLVNFVTFTLLDIEAVGEFNGRGFFEAFNGEDSVQKVTWSSLDPMLDFGNHSANSVSVMLTSPANKLVFDLGGSGALGELVIDRVPEPGSLFVLGLGLVALAAARARTRR